MIIRISGERLMAMYDNDMGVYLTPGADQPYWASGPNFQNDYCVATAHDIIGSVEMDMDMDDLRTSEAEIEYEVEAQ